MRDFPDGNKNKATFSLCCLGISQSLLDKIVKVFVI